MTKEVPKRRLNERRLFRSLREPSYDRNVVIPDRQILVEIGVKRTFVQDGGEEVMNLFMLAYSVGIQIRLDVDDVGYLWRSKLSTAYGYFDDAKAFEIGTTPLVATHARRTLDRRGWDGFSN